MTLQIAHSFQTSQAQSANSNLVSRSAWNEAHSITMVGPAVLGRQSPTSGAVAELSPLSGTGYALREAGGEIGWGPLTAGGFADSNLVSISGQIQGDLIVRGVSSWNRLPISTSGYHLQSNGISADWMGFAQSGVGAVIRTWEDKHRDFINVKDFGTLHNGSSTQGVDSAVFQAAANRLKVLGGGRLRVPGGLYSAVFTIDCPVIIEGEGPGATFIQSWYTDSIVIDALSNCTMFGLKDVTVFGKGVNYDVGTFGASKPAIRACSQIVFAYLSNCKVWGGSRPLENAANDSYFEHIDAGLGYGDAICYTEGANFYMRPKFNQDGVGINPTTSGPYAAWTPNNAISVGGVRAISTYAYIATSVKGTGLTSLTTTPALTNYSVSVLDRDVYWTLLRPISYSAIKFAGPSGENHLLQMDGSGDYSESLLFTSSNTTFKAKQCTFASAIKVYSGNIINIDGCTLGGGLEVGTGFLGSLVFGPGNQAVGAVNVDIGAGVNNFIVIHNDLHGGIINTSGASSNFVVDGNIRATISNQATGVSQYVRGPGYDGIAKFSAIKTGTQATLASNAFTNVSWSSEVYDVGGYFANGKWTPPAGPIRMTLGLYWDGGGISTGKYAIAAIYKDGAPWRKGIWYAGAHNDASGFLSADDNAAGTNVYEAYGFHEGISTMNINSNSNFSYFMGSMI